MTAERFQEDPSIPDTVMDSLSDIGLLYALADFVADIQPEDLQHHLGRVFSQPDNSHNAYFVAADETIYSATTMGSAGLSFVGGELLRMNHPSLWTSLLEEDSNATGDFTDIFPRSDPTKLLPIVGEIIATNNLKFLGHTLIDYSAAVLYGETDYPAVAYTDEFGYDARYDAGKAASKLFQGPVSSTSEVIPRLQQLFPPNIDDGPPLAFTFATNARAFSQQLDPTLPHAICPAIRLTKDLFEGYGKVLAQKGYQSDLQARLDRLTQ